MNQKMGRPSLPNGVTSRVLPRLRQYQAWADDELSKWSVTGWAVEIIRKDSYWECHVSGPKGKLWRDLESTSSEADLRYAVSSLVEELKK